MVRRLVARAALAAVMIPAILIQASMAAAQAVPLGQTRDTDWPTFKTTRSLATVDCVVTDEDKRQITDLTLDDFEVKYDRKIQKLTNVTYVPMRSGRVPAAPVQSPDNSGVPNRRTLAIGPQPGAIGAEQVTRTIAIVVDDLGLSFRGAFDVRRALTRFVDEQVAPGDLVAVLRTSGGMGALQQFTTDKRLLRAAIDKVQWTPISRRWITTFEPMAPGENPGPTEPRLRADERTRRAAGASLPEDSLDEVRMRVFATGTLGALSFVVRGVRDLPGRKAVVFASEGFDLFNRIGAVDVWSAFVRLMDEASRAGVVIYTLGAAGLQTGGLTAEDNPQIPQRQPGAAGNDAEQMRTLLIRSKSTREADIRNSQEVLYFLAKQTGGLSFLNTNDLAGSLGRVMQDLTGYYLLGFDLPDDKPRRWDPGRVSVRVKREGVTVRWRQGIFGPAVKEEKDDPPRDPLIMAAVSPFYASAIPVRLTSLFGHDARQGAYIRSLLFVDPNALSFTKAADGQHEAKLEVALLAVGENGQVAGNWRRLITLRLTDAQLEDAQRQGVVYHVRMIVKNPGGYQVRVAVRDMANEALGSASQFVDVPPVGEGRVAASGVLLRSHRPDASSTAARADASSTAASGEESPDDVLGEPPVRIFKPGSKVVYAYQIYDGLDEDSQVQVSTALLREGKALYRSAETPVAPRPPKPKGKNAARVVPIAGLLTLGDDVPPGPYTLQVVVNVDKKPKALQFADFEVRR